MEIRRLSTDIKGPMSVAGPNGELCMQLYTEDDTKWRVCKTLVSKSDALEATKQLIKVELASEGQRVLEYHSDSAPELILKDMVALLAGEKCKTTYLSSMALRRGPTGPFGSQLTPCC